MEYPISSWHTAGIRSIQMDSFVTSLFSSKAQDRRRLVNIGVNSNVLKCAFSVRQYLRLAKRIPKGIITVGL